MSDTTTIGSTIIAALEQAYGAVLARHDELPTNVVFITGKGANGQGVKLGHWAQERWTGREETDTDERVHELFIGGECLGRGPRAVMKTLIHEAAHALGTVRDVKNTSRQGRYHNKKFKGLAEELGLVWQTEEDGTAKPPCDRQGYSGMEMPDGTAELYTEAIDQLDKAITAALDAGALTEAPQPRPPRKVMLCTFEDGTEVELGLRKYEELEYQLLPHEVELIEK